MRLLARDPADRYRRRPRSSKNSGGYGTLCLQPPPWETYRRHRGYLADKGFSGIEWERRWLESGELRGVGRRHSQEQRPQGLAEGGPPLGRWQASDHRGGDLPAEGPVLPRTPPGEDFGGLAEPPYGEDRRLHLRSKAERTARSTTAPLGGSSRLAHCTSVVLEGVVEAATPGLFQRERGRGPCVAVGTEFEATSSAGGLVMDDWALLMIKDPEPQSLQATPSAQYQ
jgi:hypothetical protein